MPSTTRSPAFEASVLGFKAYELEDRKQRQSHPFFLRRGWRVRILGPDFCHLQTYTWSRFLEDEAQGEMKPRKFRSLRLSSHSLCQKMLIARIQNED